MRNWSLILKTFAVLSVTVLVVGGLGLWWLESTVAATYLELQAEASRAQADRITSQIEQHLAAGETTGEVLRRLQAGFEATPGDTGGFVCLLGADGSVLGHPERKAIGMSMTDVHVVDLEGRPAGTMGRRAETRREGAFLLADPSGETRGEIVYQRPVGGAPWLVSVHSSRSLLDQRAARLKRGVLLVAFPVGLLLVFAGTLATRAVARRYEREVETANRMLETRVNERTAELARALNELQRSQTAMVRNEKMSLLGQLMSGLAHELNNPLTSVVANAELLQREKILEQLSGRVDAIYNAGDRCRRLVRTFLDFARNTPPQTKPHDLNEIARKACLLIEGRLRSSGIRLDLELSEPIPAVLGDSLHLEQVVLNLVSNAADALVERSERGTITVSTALDRDGLVLRVRDDGPGIPHAVLSRLFEPFNTSKPEGAGTGLGLSLCRRFVEAHDGAIALEETGEEGTSFRIRLPAA